jgi:hypothetical protein
LGPRPSRNIPANDNGRVVIATRITLDDVDLRHLAMALAPFLIEELALVLPASKIPLADVPRRRGKEMSQWRRELGARERSDHTQYEDHDGESSWSTSQATELLGILKRRKKQSRSSGP